MQDIKRIVEVIHPNEMLRTYGTTKNIEGIDKYLTIYGLDTEMPEAARPLVEELWAVPAVKQISFSRGEIRIEVSDAWHDLWDEHVSPVIRDIINRHLFNGEAECTVRDDAARYREHEARYGRDDD